MLSLVELAAELDGDVSKAWSPTKAWSARRAARAMKKAQKGTMTERMAQKATEAATPVINSASEEFKTATKESIASLDDAFRRGAASVSQAGQDTLRRSGRHLAVQIGAGVAGGASVPVVAHHGLGYLRDKDKRKNGQG